MRLLFFILILMILSCSSTGKKTKIVYPDCTSTDIEMNDTCLLGKPLKYAIQLLRLDTARFMAFDEPPGILRGIFSHDIDTCDIELIVRRTSIIDTMDKMDYRLFYTIILDSPIVEVSWRKNKLNKGRTIRL